MEWKRNGDKIAFVPTMGALHEGHLSLMKLGRKLADRLVVSIFVNPLQFGRNEDLDKYPRNIDEDSKKVGATGADIIFLPTTETMYPAGHQTYVEVTNATKGLCGDSRPAHFKGVTTIVTKLFNIIMPNKAIFGEKDYQQLAVIRQMAKDLNMPVEIVGSPTIREKDGLAMSSRNAYLSDKERSAATEIYKSMNQVKELVKNGERDTKNLCNVVKGIIEGANILKTDYIKICNSETLEELAQAQPPARLLIAVFAGKTRLIDNSHLL